MVESNARPPLPLSGMGVLEARRAVRKDGMSDGLTAALVELDSGPSRQESPATTIACATRR
jgi:hypothetical protein